MKSKTIYFAVLIIFLGISSLCAFFIYATAPVLIQLCPLLAITVGIFSLYFLKAFISYEERTVKDPSKKSKQEMLACAISAASGSMALIFVGKLLDWNFSSLIFRFGSIAVSFIISASVCAFTGVTEDPNDKNDDDEILKNIKSINTHKDEEDELNKNRSDHGVYS